ncbi:hypothetical protein LTR33_006760 [Friedmanniomyces endolithicus]|nr:hypothetical protein LTR33_006760 [Friedmanniomyces endolithicus]
MPTKPTIHTLRDLTTICEVLDSDTLQLRHSNFSYVDQHDYVWFGRAYQPKLTLDAAKVSQALELLPDAKANPLAPEGLTVVAHVNASTTYTKRPKLSLVDDDEAPGLSSWMLLQEVSILQILHQHPHPNIVQYLGCTVRRGYITGIVLERCNTTLQKQSENDSLSLNVRPLMCGIRAGVAHLHSLGYAHNDLNPMNIGINYDGRAIVLDLGSCGMFGSALVSAGTPGWADEIYTSEPENDLKAMELLEAWLLKQRPDLGSKNS